MSEGEEEVYGDLLTTHYHEVLVARELELLDAIEHLVEKAAIGQGQLAEGAAKKKVNLDANGHRAKADVDLAHSARQMAERAIEEDRVFKLGPLDPRARRVVHMTLKEFPGVVTKSEGEGVFRRVCIIPKSTSAEVEVTSVGDNGDEPAEG
jgi:spoIIIJ-associated protein